MRLQLRGEMAMEECAFARKPSIILEQFLHISGTVSRARGIIILTFVQNNWTVIASLLREDTEHEVQNPETVAEEKR